MLQFRKPDHVKTEYIRIPVQGKQLRVLVCRPIERKGKAPGVLWLHGGGYMTGMPEMVYMSRAIDLVTACGAVVISPAYTLSYKAPYPKALNECHEVLLYMKEQADILGIRSDQIMVGGESAGGGLCAALCMLAKDCQSVNIAFQMPLYPMLDCMDTASSKDNHEKIWNTHRNHMAWSIYLRSLKKETDIPCYASPARRENYEGLPPCYTFVGDIEPFYEEALTYICNLRNAGVPAFVDVYKDFYHAYDMMHPETEEVKQARKRFISAFRQACQTYCAPQKG